MANSDAGDAPPFDLSTPEGWRAYQAMIMGVDEASQRRLDEAFRRLEQEEEPRRRGWWPW